MVRCNKCDKVLGEYLLSAYGDAVCEDCWDEYICTKEGKVEYLLGICRGDYPATEFDNEFLLEVVESWNENKNIIQPFIPKQLFNMCEIRAQVLKNL
jgi:phage FluMu protein Com